jgi:2-dehydro-3-deoxygalactonokinase
MTNNVPASAQGSGDLVQKNPPGCLPAATRALVAKFSATNPQWDGVVCLPGDPSHWVHLSAGEIVSFQSFLSLRLARTLGAEDSVNTHAVEETMARPERLATHLASAEFSKNRDATFGHLLGAELAAAKAYWLGQQVVIIGNDAGYGAALRALGVPVSSA